MNHIKNILIGMILGVANVIPGVSAGTMAVSLGIYDKLLDAISLKKEKLKKNFPFLVSLAIGVAVGILVFSNAITYLYDHYSIETSFAFIGIIIGSIPMVWRNIAKEGKVQTVGWIPCIITFMIMLIMAFTAEDASNQVVMTSVNIVESIWLIIAGAISAFTMIIPGISGSFIMLTLGVYTTTIGAISDMNLLILIPVGIGVLIGLLGGTKIVKILLNKYRQTTYLAILGLVVGSIFTLYPGFYFNISGIIAIVLMIIGAYISYYFSDK
ncbi:MAG: DUF368 domain-containing protein [Cellulosilyticaceae bacterium]